VSNGIFSTNRLQEYEIYHAGPVDNTNTSYNKTMKQHIKLIKS